SLDDALNAGWQYRIRKELIDRHAEIADRAFPVGPGTQHILGFCGKDIGSILTRSRRRASVVDQAAYARQPALIETIVFAECRANGVHVRRISSKKTTYPKPACSGAPPSRLCLPGMSGANDRFRALTIVATTHRAKHLHRRHRAALR